MGAFSLAEWLLVSQKKNLLREFYLFISFTWFVQRIYYDNSAPLTDRSDQFVNSY